MPGVRAQPPSGDDYANSAYAQAQQKPSTGPAEKPGPPPRPPTPPVTPMDQLAAAAPTVGRLDISQLPSAEPIVMLGDQLNIPGIAFGPPGNPRFPPVPGTTKAGILAPTVRSFKIADDEAPAPQDRVYFGFNYWDNVNKSVNQRFGGDFNYMQAN